MSTARHVWGGCLAGTATAATYSGFLAWDTTYYTGSDGQLHGPYEPWQVISVVLLLGLIAFLGGRFEVPIPVITAEAVVMTVGFSISGATSNENDGLWPIGSLLVMVGTLAGTSLVGWIGWAVAQRSKPRRVWTPPPG